MSAAATRWSGHSERRAIYGDSNALVARKFVGAHSRELVPILCVGEQLAEREAGRTHEVVGAQLDAVLQALPGCTSLAGAVLAYEPVWAIGTGRTATPEQAQEVHSIHTPAGGQARMLKSPPGCAFCMAAASRPATLLGIFAMPDVDGGLIGGASLKADEFSGDRRAALVPKQG